MTSQRVLWLCTKQIQAGLFCLLLLSLAPLSYGQPSGKPSYPKNARTLFMRMFDTHDFTYNGILTYERGGHLHSYTIDSESMESLASESSGVDNKVQSLNALSGPVRDYLFVSGQDNHVDTTCGRRPPPSLEEFAESYNFFYQGSGRSGGRLGHDIVLMPMDDYRLSYRYLVDKKTGFMLRSVAMLPDRTVLERTQFVDLNIQADGVKKLPKVGENPAESRCPPLSTKSLGWSVGWVPHGFSLLSQSKQGAEVMLHFGDGISTFTVFIEPSGLASMPPGNLQNGATAMAIRHYLNPKGSYMMTFVGEVTLKTAELVLQNLEPIE